MTTIDTAPQITASTDPAANAIPTNLAPACRRPRHTMLIGVIAAIAVLFVGMSAFAGAAIESTLVDRAGAATRLEVARTAAAAITSLWTYSPDKIATLPDRAGEYLGDEFCAQYRKFLEATIAPIKQAQVTDRTDVVGIAVESLNRDDAVVLAFTNTTATSPLTKDIPSLKYLAYRMSMKHKGSRWMVTAMSIAM